ncbi:MAG: hypothetical protein CVV41_05650 [Candidatus Riflebacteria bacterium HGW-Riflebacteria-1]|jgi:radical SAM superfamily enzyme YgiQ (UPF0313 family)|nr:MAG: hypothetical protein CVV41_05650 [Candidatus Riflebacteria bacterium HGW-Riflebacteria-1]
MLIAQQIREWFAANRQRLTGRGVWFQGGEPGTQNPEEFSRARLRVLIVRLSPYSEVAAGITHTYLYQMAAAVAGVFVDMAFMPPENDERLFREAGVPLLSGVGSKEPATAFDLVAVSNSVLQELINLPALLRYSGLPLSCRQRDEQGSPLLVLGGSNSYTHSILHGPVSGDCGLVDAVLMGDGEQVFARMLALLRDNATLPRSEKLSLLQSSLPGLYLPGSYHQVFTDNPSLVGSLPSRCSPTNDGELIAIEAEAGAPLPVPSNKTACSDTSETWLGGPLLYEGAGSSHVLVSAGCPSFCSFCKESWEQKPYRETPLEQALAAARQLKAGLGLSEISLMTFNANTCSDIYALVDRLGQMFARVSIKSQRFDAVVNAPELLDLQFEAGKRTYTCAMEGISDRMRILLQKNLDEKTILAGVDLLMQRNMRQMKVFLILTGYEQDADVDEFRAFLEKIRQRTAGGKARPRLTFSFAVLFRAPQTPMQYAPSRCSAAAMQKQLDALCAIISAAGFEARISSGPEDAEVSEFIAYADRRHTPILVEASIARGFRYHGEISRKLHEFWRQRLKQLRLTLLCDSERSPATVFPWDDIDTGISKTFLYKIWQQIESGGEIRACLAAPWGSGKCAGCGACRSPGEMSALNQLGPELSPTRAKPAEQKTGQLWLLFRVPARWAYCSREFVAAALARRFMLDVPGAVDWFRRVELLEPAFFSHGLALACLNGCGKAPELPRNAETVIGGAHVAAHDSSDIEIVSLLPSVKKAEECLYPMLLAANMPGETGAVAREIDELLTRYKLKNQKQRQNGWMNWQINTGQAKKSGLSKISLREEDALLQVTLLSQPELFMLNKLFADHPPAIIRLSCPPKG